MRELNHLFGLSSRTRGRPMISYARRGLNQTTGVVEATWGIRSSPFSRYMGSSLLGLAAPDLTVAEHGVDGASEATGRGHSGDLPPEALTGPFIGL